MGDLSTHFSRWEFACKCGCGFDTVDHALLEVLEKEHAHFNALHAAAIRIIITGGNRCREYNDRLRAAALADGRPRDAPAEDSQHVYARAADHRVERLSHLGRWVPLEADTVADYLDRTHPLEYGIGRYPGRTHLDTRKGPKRWDY